MNEITLIGLKRFTSKKGNEVCMLITSRPCTDVDNANGSYGVDIHEIFAPKEQVNSFKASDIGKKVKLEYGIGMYGRPEITHVVLQQARTRLNP